MRIYVVTSVINGLYAQDFNIKKVTTNFFKNVQVLGYNLYASEATIEEIENTPQKSKRILLTNTVKDSYIEILSVVEEARWLANHYIKAKIIPQKYFPDALHIAIATIYNIPYVTITFETIM